MPCCRFPLSVLPLSALMTAALLMAGCVSSSNQLASARLPLSPDECGGQGAEHGAANCRFRNAPLELEQKPVTLPGRPYTFYPTAKELDFTDGKGKAWAAPRQTLTDGASIPPVFVSVIGNPQKPEFALAAAMHDAYCGIGNETGAAYHAATWQEVHRMFYDTLVAGGTGPKRAKIMFAAVWLGGPRWYPQSGAPDLTVERLPLGERRAALRNTIAFIEATDPDLPGVIRYADAQERAMLTRARALERAEDRADAGRQPEPSSAAAAAP